MPVFKIGDSDARKQIFPFFFKSQQFMSFSHGPHQKRCHSATDRGQLVLNVKYSFETIFIL